MNKSISIVIFFVSQIIVAQNINSLTLKLTQVSELSPSKSDSFFVNMQKGQFASIHITEKNVRIHALVFDPQDSLIQIIDENQMGNKEVVSIFSKKTGDYKIKVGWNFDKPYSGKYTITLDKLETAGKTPNQKAQQLIDGWYEYNAPGAAIAVVKNGKIVFKATKGLANMEENIPIQSNSIFELASCSKQFTGLAVAMLIDQGKISLDDDIRTYLPEMPDYGSPITIGNLVYHTSGIRNTDALEFAGFTPEDVFTLPMCIKFAFAQKSLKFKPGERFEYSNTNYNLLAEIIARVTGLSFSTWTKENIFKPLNMRSTFFKESPGAVYPHKTLCYTGIQSGFRQRQNNWAAMGGSALNSSLDDLVKWVTSFDNKQLITPSVEKLLYAKGSTREDGKTLYAFGNEFKTLFNGTKEIIHLGLVIGYRTAIVRYPDLKLALIYLSNDDNDATYQRFPKILDLFMMNDLRDTRPGLEEFPDAKAVVNNIEQEEQFKESMDLKQYAGSYYSGELSTIWNMKIINDRLILSNQRMNDVKLKNSGGDKFGFIEFKRDSINNVIGLKILGEGIEFLKT